MTARSVVHHALAVYFNDTHHTGGPEGIADELIDNLVKEAAPDHHASDGEAGEEGGAMDRLAGTYTYMVVDTAHETGYVRKGYTTRWNADRAAKRLAERLPYHPSVMVYATEQHQDYLEVAEHYVTDWVYKESLR